MLYETHLGTIFTLVLACIFSGQLKAVTVDFRAKCEGIVWVLFHIMISQ